MRHRTKINRALVRPPCRFLLVFILLFTPIVPTITVGANPPPTTLIQQAKLSASDGVPSDYFAQSVALSRDGNTAIVGAFGKGNGMGAAYVFTRSGGAWGQRQDLAISGATNRDYFGYAVAISGDGNTVLVGAWGGAAYVYTKVGATWTLQQKLIANDAPLINSFGFAVAVSYDGNTVIIGAYADQNYAGAAYIFARSGTIWTQQQKLIASDRATDNLFGWAVAMSDDGATAIIEALQKQNFTGAAYIFGRIGGTWAQLQELTVGDIAPHDEFGKGLAMSADARILFLGAPGKNNSTGAAYIFVRNGTAWTEQQELIASDGAQNDYLGQRAATSIDGSTTVISANARHGNTGAAYVFVRAGTAWIQQQVVTASDGAQNDYFATALAVDARASTALFGSVGQNDAYVFAAETPSSIMVRAGSGSVQVKVGQSVPFTATGTYSDGSTADLTGQVQWSSKPLTIATVNAGGMVTGQAPGGATITATLGDMSGSVMVTVVPPTPLGIVVPPVPAGRPAAPSPTGPSPAPMPIPAPR
ncbi:MAG: Ig-like domain-containing protein [Thermomicrobiales bacterium]